MAKKMHEVYALDVRAAELEGKKKLFISWSEAEQAEHTQSQWRAICNWLQTDLLRIAFCTDIGNATSTITGWARNADLPHEKVCAVYITLIIEKIDDELAQIAEQREMLLNPPEKKSKAEDEFPLPKQKIVSFKRPDSLPAEALIADLEGYHSLPSRARDCLRNDNMLTAESLTLPDMWPSDTWQGVMLRIPNFGGKSLGSVYHFMINNGFVPTLAE